MKTHAPHSKSSRQADRSRRTPTAAAAWRSQSGDVQTLVRGPGVQTQLTIGAPGDRFEQEADRVADAVIRMPASDVPASVTPAPAGACQRQVEEEALTFPDAEFLSMKARPDAAPPAISAAPDVGRLEGRGSPLDHGLRADMEDRFGADFGAVRIHRDADAAKTAASIGARAFTYRHHIAFAPGEYRPASTMGRHLLAHELTHVLQQRGVGQRIQRACNCTTGRRATAAEHARLSGPFPHLVADDYCIIGPRDPSYNCIAWSVGDSSQWIWNQVDSIYGDNDGTVSISDFDAFYDTVAGLIPQQYPDSNTKVALFAKGLNPTHAAPTNPGNPSCGAIPFTSKLGKAWKIAHGLSQLEGGKVYGDVVRYYE